MHVVVKSKEWYRSRETIMRQKYRNESNYSNYPIIQTSPFSRKKLIIVFQAFEYPRIPISEHLHLVEFEQGSLNVS